MKSKYDQVVSESFIRLIYVTVLKICLQYFFLVEVGDLNSLLAYMRHIVYPSASDVTLISISFLPYLT